MKFWKKKEKDRQTIWFLQNGSILLQELIADCNGKSNPIRSFSSDQILKATKNFDPSCFVSRDVYYTWYKGTVEDRFYMIKKFSEEEVTGHRVGELYNDIVMSARMGNHNNFLKLLGCCLEFPLPVLVFEYAENGVMDPQGGIASNDKLILPWNVRLKIGKEIADAVTYLHTASPRIIIHRDIKPMHVFLDKNWTAKLSDLSFSIALPEGKSRIEDKVLGTMGYLDPSYHSSCFVTEYTDVYSFGIFLMVLLIGRPAVIKRSDGLPVHILGYVKRLQENGELVEAVDQAMAKDITTGQQSQMEALVALALRCCVENEEDRPKMMQVAKDLKQIERPCTQ